MTAHFDLARAKLTAEIVRMAFGLPRLAATRKAGQR